MNRLLRGRAARNCLCIEKEKIHYSTLKNVSCKIPYRPFTSDFEQKLPCGRLYFARYVKTLRQTTVFISRCLAADA